jgi:hypothetical protein
MTGFSYLARKPLSRSNMILVPGPQVVVSGLGVGQPRLGPGPMCVKWAGISGGAIGFSGARVSQSAGHAQAVPCRKTRQSPRRRPTRLGSQKWRTTEGRWATQHNRGRRIVGGSGSRQGVDALAPLATGAFGCRLAWVACVGVPASHYGDLQLFHLDVSSKAGVPVAQRH